MRVKDLNATRDQIRSLREKVAADLGNLSALCASMSDEVSRRYYEELNRSEGKTDGLEEFQAVARLLRRDAQAAAGARAIESDRVKGAEGYDFQEMEEAASEQAVR